MREIREEAGIEVEELVLRGTISWPGFGKNEEDWFASSSNRSLERHAAGGQSRGRAGMGAAHTPARAELVDSDRMWLDMVFERTPKMFHGIAPYKDGKLVSWAYTLFERPDERLAAKPRLTKSA